LLTACSGGHAPPQQGDRDRDRGGDGDDSAGEAIAGPAPGAPMSDFQKALTAFRRTAARRLEQPEATLSVGPDAENQVGLPDAALPPFIAFQAEAGRRILRGLAAPSGVVVLVWQDQIENLGPLLEAAHALDRQRALPAVEIAERIAWLHGPAHFLIATGHDTWKGAGLPPADRIEPTLVHGADGAAELRFLANRAGNTGVVLTYQFVIRVRPGYQASATVERMP
jgi:hypothetical protein